MGFEKGTATVRRYQVLGEIPEELPLTATVALRRHKWRPIDDRKGEGKSQGWVNPRNLLGEEITWEDLLVHDGLIFLGFRVDKKSYSKVLFNARLEVKKAIVREEKKAEKISKNQIAALKEELNIEMLKETSPRSAFTELIWEMNSNIVLMSSTVNSNCDEIAETFRNTFDLQLKPLFPSVIGSEFITREGLTQEFALATGAQGG